jgi:hypothetical protein
MTQRNRSVMTTFQFQPVANCNVQQGTAVVGEICMHACSITRCSLWTAGELRRDPPNRATCMPTFFFLVRSSQSISILRIIILRGRELLQFLIHIPNGWTRPRIKPASSSSSVHSVRSHRNIFCGPTRSLSFSFSNQIKKGERSG